MNNMNRHNPRRARRGFSLLEMLVALGICSALLTATLVSLHASFRAYQSTTEQASTHVIGRVVMHRVMALVRNGVGFGPLPEDPRETSIATDEMTFLDDQEREITLRLDRVHSVLLMQVDNGAEQVLLDPNQWSKDGSVALGRWVPSWDGRLVGFARSLTDFCFCCYLSDLAVDKACQGQGIGKRLIEETRKHAGGELTTTLLLSAPTAMTFYQGIKMPAADNCFLYRRSR